MPDWLHAVLLGCVVLQYGCQNTRHSCDVFIEAKQYQGEGLYVFFVPDTLQDTDVTPTEGDRLLFMHMVNATGQTLLIDDVANYNSPAIYVSAKAADVKDGHRYYSPCLRVGQLRFQEYEPVPRGEMERMLKMRWLMHQHAVEHRTYQYGSKAVPIAVPDWEVPMIVTIDDSLRTYSTQPATHVYLPINAEVRVEPKSPSVDELK